uniref:ARAD1D37796p n=1 Tax=Blastobotrys adeninivorans TaxID=409370 RepID=A0A060TCP8_BLAAD
MTQPVDRKRSGKVSGSLFSFTVAKDAKTLAPALLFTIAGAIIPPALSILLGKVFDALSGFGTGQLSSDQFMEKVVSAVIGIVSLGIGSVAVGWMMVTLWCRFSDSQSQRVQRAVFSNFLSRDMSWFDQNCGVIGLLTISNRNIEDFRVATSICLAYTTQSAITMVLCLVLALIKSWSLTLVTLAGVPVIVLISAVLARFINRNLEASKEQMQIASNNANWTIHCLETVKMFNRELTEIKNFDNSIKLAKKLYLRFCHFLCLQLGICRAVSLTMFVQGFFFGSYLVRHRKASSGDVLTVFWCCITVAQSFNSISIQMVLIKKGQVAVQWLNRTLAEKTKSSSIGFYPPPAKGSIEFFKVSFQYPSRKLVPILNKFSFSVAPYSMTFIVGQSGCGKSTISNLLLRIYDNYKGIIRVDGYGLDTINPKWLHDNIHVVEQQSVMYNATLADNIKVGHRNPSDVTDEELQLACKAAMFDFMEELPQGLDTVIGNEGVQLSGGQKQRVALARAYLNNSPIMVFDEALSALDVALRFKAMESIRRFRAGKTSLVITHEFSQIDPSDRVAVMRKGEILEQGIRRDLESDSHSEFNIMLNSTSPLTQETSQLLHEEFQSYDNKKESQFKILEDTMARESAACKFYRSLRRKLVRERDYAKDEEASIGEPTTKPTDRDSTLRILKEIFLSIDDKPLLILGLLFTIANGVSNPVFSFAFSNLITTIVPKQDGAESQANTSLKWAMVVLAVALIDGFTTYLRIALDAVAERWIFKLRSEMFQSIVHGQMEWFNKENHSSDALSHLLVNHTDDMRMIITRFLSAATTILILTFTALLWCFIVGWRLTLIGMALLPGFLIASKIYKSITDRWEEEYQKANEQTIELASEVVKKIKSVKTLGLETHFTETFKNRERYNDRIGFRKAFFIGFGYGLSHLFMFVTIGVLLWYGMNQISTGNYSLQQTMLVFTLLVFSLVTVSQLMDTIPQSSSGFDAFKGMRKAKFIPIEEKTGISGNHLLGDIELKNVNFSYMGSKKTVLSNLSFSIPAGNVIALVGPSGSGKSTVIGLLTRLYNPTSGSVTISGQNIREISLTHYRNQVAVVRQMPLHFLDGSIAANLRYANENAEASIEDVCRECSIDDFISSLREGYETRLGDQNGGGAHLSGGQMQRLGIARALLRQPKILILDECTSALDPESISAIKEMIRRQRGMTIVMITHQQEMMELADKVIHIEACQSF